MRYLIIFLGLLVWVSLAMANPVIYQGGQMVDSVVDSKSTDIQWFYSLTSRMAIGYRYFNSVSEASPVHMGQANFLINRWNEPDSQANIYVLTGMGVQDRTIVPYLGAEADWESRVFLTSISVEQFWAQTSVNKAVLRVGMAPYVAEYDDLNTWIILQVTQLNTGPQSTQWILPMVRFFKDNILAEFGSNGSTYQASIRIHF